MRNEFSAASLSSLAAVVLAISMTFSPFLLSVGMWLLTAAAVWHLYNTETGSAWQRLKVSWLHWWSRPEYVALSLLFWVVALSGLWSDTGAFWWERTRIRIPFLLLPWVFANLPRLNTAQLYEVPLRLCQSLVVLCAGVLLNFLSDPETILLGLSEGQPIPVPRSHIRFNLMLVVAVVSGGWLWSRHHYWTTPARRTWFGAAVLFLFLCIHFLAVRSGLIALYGALFFATFWWVIRTKNWWWGSVALSVIVALPLIAWMMLPSLQNRISYMQSDWEHYRSQTGGESYSDAERFVSLRVGYEIWKDHPIIGSGIGDLERETLSKTHALYPIYDETPKLPHNQFLYVLASTGFMGLLCSFLAWLYPWRFVRYRNNFLWVVFQVVICISFLVEYTLETSIGAAFYLFYQLWWMKMADENGSAT
jgi:O-antigen ligase